MAGVERVARVERVKVVKLLRKWLVRSCAVITVATVLCSSVCVCVCVCVLQLIRPRRIEIITRARS